MSDEYNTLGPITRHRVIEAIQSDRIIEAMEKGGTNEQIQRRIDLALARPVGYEEIMARWKDMKNSQRTAKTRANRRRKEVNENMLNELRSYDAERTDLDEMVALSTFGRAMKSEYIRQTIPIPSWIEDRLRSLDNDIRAQRRDALEKKKKELLSRKEALKTAEQKRQDVDAELEKVTKALGEAP